MKWLLIGLLIIGIGYKAQGIAITDFEPPVSRAKTSFIMGSYDYERSSEGKITSDHGNLSLNFIQFYSSLPFAYNSSLLGLVERNGSAEVDSERMVYNISGKGQVNKYLYKDIFGMVKLSVDSIRGYFQPKFSSREKFSASMGLGYGRFIVATPMARAVRVAEELGRVDLLTGPLPDSTYLLLAEQLDPYMIRSYQEHYDFWEREYYRDISRILRESGQLKEGVLGSVGTVVVSDILDEYILPRYYGYEITGGFGYTLSIPSENSSLKPFTELTFEFGRPIGLKSQLAGFLTLKNYIIEGKFESRLSLDQLRFTYSYEISNNLDLFLAYNLSGSIPFEETPSLSQEMDIEFHYYIVNQLNFTTRFSLNTPPGEYTKFKTSFSSGIKYRFF